MDQPIAGRSRVITSDILEKVKSTFNPALKVKPGGEIFKLRVALLKDIPKDRFEPYGTGVYLERKGHHLWTVEKEGDGFVLTRNKEETDFDNLEPVAEDKGDGASGKMAKRAQQGLSADDRVVFELEGKEYQGVVDRVEGSNVVVTVIGEGGSQATIPIDQVRKVGKKAQNLITTTPADAVQPLSEGGEEEKKKMFQQEELAKCKKGRILFGQDWEEFEVEDERDGVLDVYFPKDQHRAKYSLDDLEIMGVRWAKVAVDETTKDYYENYYGGSPYSKGYGESLVKEKVKKVKSQVLNGLELERKGKDAKTVRNYWKKLYKIHNDEKFIRGARQWEIRQVKKSQRPFEVGDSVTIMTNPHHAYDPAMQNIQGKIVEIKKGRGFGGVDLYEIEYDLKQGGTEVRPFADIHFKHL